ncbi:MAG: flavodoxin family protein [Clostridia bacterium]|nr:flavodoxin family protein [Clostridia bacterium]
MKVILVNGSPHEKGSTNRALGKIAATLQAEGIEAEILWLGSDAVAGCRGCSACRKLGKCVTEDAVNRLAPKLLEADGLVFGSPVHYAAPGGTITSFMDRLFYAFGGAMAGKPACAVVACRRGGASAAFDQLNKYFTISSMPIVSGQYWNSVHGTSAQEVERDEEGLQVMRSLGRNMAWLLRCIEAGKRAGILFPEKETAKRTNFIR